MRLNRRPILILAAILGMTVLVTSSPAHAHAGPHERGTAIKQEQQAPQGAVAILLETTRPHQTDRQCGASMCCGSACYSGGTVMAGDIFVLQQVEIGSRILATETIAGPGLGQSGIRRPPRA